jgi:hypothetical protein
MGLDVTDERDPRDYLGVAEFLSDAKEDPTSAIHLRTKTSSCYTCGTDTWVDYSGDVFEIVSVAGHGSWISQVERDDTYCAGSGQLNETRTQYWSRAISRLTDTEMAQIVKFYEG